MDADVVGLDPALGEQFLDVAVRPPEAQVPADREDDDVWGKRKPARRTSWREQDEGGEFSYRQSHWSDTVAAHAQCPEVSSARRSAPRGSRKVFRSGQVRSVE
jgi:hypothetical protein